MITSFLMVLAWARQYVKIRLRFDFGTWKRFLRESYALGIAAVITFVYFKVDTIMLSVMKSSADVGIYNAAYKVLENLSFFPAMIVGLIFPLMSKYVYAERDKFEEIANKTYKVFMLIVVPLVIGTLFLADGIIRAIGGGGFSESAAVLRVLVFAIAFIFFGNFFNAVLIAAGLQKKLLFVMAIAAIFNVAANLIFIPKFSYTAAAYISAMTEFIVTFGTFLYAAKKLKYYPRSENLGGILVSGAAMAIALYLLRGKNFIIAGMAGMLVYLVFIVIFKAVGAEEITSIISKRGVEEFDPHQTNIE
jgi:O-antigen/teichoic acid export membrane protein